MKKIALFPGSFDPFTKGHESVIQKAIPLFDEIVIGIGINTSKNYFFELEKPVDHEVAFLPLHNLQEIIQSLLL